jgi:hypothetical protein
LPCFHYYAAIIFDADAMTYYCFAADAAAYATFAAYAAMPLAPLIAAMPGAIIFISPLMPILADAAADAISAAARCLPLFSLR